MGQANIVIKNIKPLKMPKVEIETNEMKRYVSDLSDLIKVYCFPKTQEEWETVSIGGSGFNAIWSTRFEVHVDQIVDTAESIEELKLQA